jgi:L-aspartate oxidase
VSEHSTVLVVGSGIAALRAAIELADLGDVRVLTKADSAEGNTGYAQGGIAAAVGPDDSPELHFEDTIAAGDGLCDAAAVRVLVESGPRDVAELVAWGAVFDRDADGRPALGREAAHRVRRVLHARDAPGREIGRVLWQRATESARVRVVEHARAVSLILRDGACVGVRYLDRGVMREIHAEATLLATGGAGQVYRETTNPEVASGDGIAMAWLAGARVADLEFVQFHPTALDVPGRPRFLLSEALRGEGARLLNADGEPFMARYESAGDLAPRDRVSRAIVREMERTGSRVYLSLQHLDAASVHARFPLIAAACRDAGFDLARDRVPVSPAAHYVMGGIETDLEGRTSVPGLFAAGEVACTGVHGANRLASNSLLEGLVFGRRAGAAMCAFVRERQAWAPTFHAVLAATDVASPTSASLADAVDGASADGPLDVSAADVRDWMWQSVGLLRDGHRLSAAIADLDRAWAHLRARRSVERPDESRLASLVIVGRLMARAALRRHESRGGHYRFDYPERDDAHWGHRVAERIPASETGDGILFSRS